MKIRTALMTDEQFAKFLATHPVSGGGDVADPNIVNDGSFTGGGVLGDITSIIGDAATAYKTTVNANAGIYSVQTGPGTTRVISQPQGISQINYNYVILGIVAIAAVIALKS